MRLNGAERVCIVYQTALKTIGLGRYHLLHFYPLSDWQTCFYET